MHNIQYIIKVLENTSPLNPFVTLAAVSNAGLGPSALSMARLRMVKNINVYFKKTTKKYF